MEKEIPYLYRRVRTAGVSRQTSGASKSVEVEGYVERTVKEKVFPL